MTDITVRSPGRVNLIGDHTDYTGGLVFPIAIDRYTDIVGHRSPRLTFRSESEPATFDLDIGTELSDAMPEWARFVVAVAREMDADEGFTGAVSTTLPVGAGLSSSASFEIAVALALGFSGTPLELAELAQRAEWRATGVPTGIMDQLCIAAATNGHATMIDCSTKDVQQVAMPTDLAIVVRYIAHRTLVGSEYADRVAQCRAAEDALGHSLATATLPELSKVEDELVRQRARHVITENARVLAFADALSASDYALAGEIMTDGHRSLRDDFGTSTPAMDDAVATLVATPGVYGARMTGGGFGGCVVAIADPNVEIEGWHVRPVGAAQRID